MGCVTGSHCSRHRVESDSSATQKPEGQCREAGSFSASPSPPVLSPLLTPLQSHGSPCWFSVLLSMIQPLSLCIGCSPGPGCSSQKSAPPTPSLLVFIEQGLFQPPFLKVKFHPTRHSLFSVSHIISHSRQFTNFFDDLPCPLECQFQEGKDFCVLFTTVFVMGSMSLGSQ